MIEGYRLGCTIKTLLKGDHGRSWPSSKLRKTGRHVASCGAGTRRWIPWRPNPVAKPSIVGKNTKHRIVEAHSHKVNAAEPAVKVAPTMDPNCPMQVWESVIPQIQDALNMLRTSKENPKESKAICIGSL